MLTRVPASVFDALYERDHDPWGFETQWYERRKYALTLATLSRRRYLRAFEPGCSIGVFTALLAERVDDLVAVDGSPIAVDQARRRCRGLGRATIAVMTVPDEWPKGSFDLIVLSELAYYFPPGELKVLLDRCVSSLRRGGELVVVHYRLETNYPMSGDAVHAAVRAQRGLESQSHYEEPRFLIDVMTRQA